MKLKQRKTTRGSDFTWPTIFAVNVTQLCGYFYGNNKNPAMSLMLLVLALLLQILSTIGGVVIHSAWKT